MNSYLIHSLSNLNIYKKFIDPVSGVAKPWSLVIHAYNAEAETTSLVTLSFYNERIELKLKDLGDGTYEVYIEALAAQQKIDFPLELTIDANHPSYKIGSDNAGKPMLYVIGGSDMTPYLQGTQHEFPVAQSWISLKAIDNADGSGYVHEIRYGATS